MFMIDMQGTPALPTASSNWRTPSERYCGSCMHKPTRSNFDGLTPVAGPAVTLPGSLRDSSSTGSLRPRTGSLTLKPSALMSSASAGRQTRWIECPPNNNLEASSDPYEAPINKILYFVGFATAVFFTAGFLAFAGLLLLITFLIGRRS